MEDDQKVFANLFLLAQYVHNEISYWRDAGAIPLKPYALSSRESTTFFAFYLHE